MTEVWFNKPKNDAMTAWLSGRTLKAMLLKTTAAGARDPDVATVTALLAVGGVAECDFTNYVRKTLASLTATLDNTNDRSAVDSASLTWTSAGGATNNTPAALVIIDCTVDTNDGTRVPVGYYDTNFGTIATNGADWVVNISDFLRGT